MEEELRSDPHYIGTLTERSRLMEKVYLVIKVDTQDYYVVEYKVLGTYRNKENAEKRLKDVQEILEKTYGIDAELVELELDD